MISLEWFRKDFESLLERYKGCNNVDEKSLYKLRELDVEVRELKLKLDNLRNEKRKDSQSSSFTDLESLEKVREEIKKLKEQILQLEENYRAKQQEFESLLLTLPAIPSTETPETNQIVKVWGEIREFKNPKSYLELSHKLGLIDFGESVKTSGSGFVVYKGLGEKLVRALISFTLDWAESFGFQRKYLPVIVNKEALICTSQLPKFEENLFKLENSDKYLSPTAEVQLVNLFREEILLESSLPIKVCAHTNCFRAEHIGAGRETKGLIRLYQFSKTELVMLTKPEESYNAQEYLSEIIEALLQKLKLPYRKVLLSKNELSFSSSKTYDFEVFMPADKEYREISSLSNTTDFQAIRGKIRYKKELLSQQEKAKHVHILNGSCVAIDRLFAALIENYQTENSEIIIPECLVKYFETPIISPNDENKREKN